MIAPPTHSSILFPAPAPNLFALFLSGAFLASTHGARL